MSFLVQPNHFQVKIGDNPVMGFKEVSGLKVSREKFEYRDGLDPSLTKKKYAGLKTYDDITFKRGTFYKNNQFFEWWNSVQVDNLRKTDIVISLLDGGGQSIITWNVTKAWVLSVEAANLNADASEAAIETMVMCHEGLTITHNI